MSEPQTYVEPDGEPPEPRTPAPIEAAMDRWFGLLQECEPAEYGIQGERRESR